MATVAGLVATTMIFYLIDGHERGDSLEHKLLVLNEYHQTGLLDVPITGFGEKETTQFILVAALQLMESKYGLALSGLRVNSFPRDGRFLNLYFFRDDPRNALRQIRGNCVSYPSDAVVIGDLDFIERLQGIDRETLSRYKLPTGTERLEQELGGSLLDFQKSRNANVFYWIVLHELGHIAHRHRDRSFNLQMPDHSETYAPAGFAAAEIPQPSSEIEADRFFVEVLEPIEQTFGPVFARSLAISINAGMNSFIHRNMEDLAAAQRRAGQSGADNLIQITTRVSDSHPPTLLRAIWANRRLVERFEVEPPRYMDELLTYIRVKVEQ